MDVLVVDAGDIPVRAGDRVVLFGDPAMGEIPLTEWAMSVSEDAASVVCSLDPRVSRVEHA
jgi:alanine racemase